MRRNDRMESRIRSCNKLEVKYIMSALSVSTPKERLSRLRFGRRRLQQEPLTMGLLVLLSFLSFLHISSSTENVMQTASSSSSSMSFSMSSSSSHPIPNQSSHTNAYFINGLANSIRRINSTLLSFKSLNEPFQLEFRTACPFGNLIYDDHFAIGISTDGNLTYARKRLTDSEATYAVYNNVNDGHWHSLLFNGSTISFKEHREYTDDPVHFPLTLPSAQTGSLEVNLLQFFDGFVGCMKLATPNGTPIVPRSHVGDEEMYFTSTPDMADYFQLGTTPPYPACSDLSVDLRDRHHCPDPESFILCSQCQIGARCEVLEETDLDPATNQCNDTEHSHDVQTHGDEGLPTNEFSVLVENNASGFAEGPMEGSRSIQIINGPINSVPESTTRPISPENLTTPTQLRVETGNNNNNVEISSAEPSLAPCPCQHGGVCLSSSSEPGGTPICSCEGTGHYGEHCEIENTFCRSAPCLHGICQTKGDSYQCYCLPGFTGANCSENIDECLSNPCENGATCKDLVNEYKCVCAVGFRGVKCQIDIDECQPGPCLNGATCHDLVGNYSCSCLAGFTGHSCEINIDDCASSPCQNGAKCDDGINMFTCNCTDTGFEGYWCDRVVNECLLPNGGSPCQNDGTCVDGHKSYICECHGGYEGKSCEIDIDECAEANGVATCHNNGTCLQRSNISLYNSPTSSRLPAIFNGEFNYSTAGGFECQCQAGFQGKNCEIDIDECIGNPCGANGKCIDSINSFICECLPGYTGSHCKTEINECVSNNGTSPCIRGTCIDKLADYECLCPEGYGSKDCSVELTGCASIKCFNGGTCRPTYVQKQHDFLCTCTPGYAGRVCQQQTTLSFDGTGYTEILSDDEKFRKRYAMSFRFRTTLTDVLIAVGQGSTYFMLTLAGGKLNLQSSLLNILKGISSGNNVSNAEWHQAWVSINETHIALGVNLEQTIHPIQTEPEQPVETGFNTTVLGGATPGLSSLTNLPFFIGCIQDIKINDKKIVPGIDGDSVKLDQNLVKIGCTRQEQCLEGSCMNGGECIDLWAKYQCQCPRPYLGARCEFEYIAATFGHENITFSYVEIHIPVEIGRKFEKAFEISMFVRTREPRGTLFLFKDDRKDNGLFLEAFVEEDGQLGLLAKLDESKEETYSVGGLAINDGEPHLISFQKEKGLVKISVNGTEHFRKSLPLKPNQVFNPVVMYIGGVPPIQETSSTAVSSSVDTASEFEASTAQPVPQQDIIRNQRSILSGLNKMEPFKGVIQDVRISMSVSDGPGSGSHHPQTSRYVVEFFPLSHINASYLMGDSLGQVNLLGQVLKGVVSDDSCKENPCENGGICQITFNNFKCLCSEEYDGKTCSLLLPCAIVRCPLGTECRNIQAGTGFECLSDVTFDGKGTVSPHYRLRSMSDIENLTFNDITFKYRSQRGGSILHISDGLDKSLKISLEQEFTQQGRMSYVAVQVNGNRSLERIQGALNGSWHALKLSLDPESRNFVLNYDGNNKKNPIGVNISPDFIKSIVTSANAELILGSFIKSGSSSSYKFENGRDNLQDHHVAHAESLHGDFYRGCLSDVLIGNFRLPFVSPIQLLTINPENISLVETTAPTAFYIDEHGEGDITAGFRTDTGCVLCFDKECLNGGFCEDIHTSYDCQCALGYNGSLCQENIDECHGNQCATGSTCLDGVGNYTCNCLAGYTGWLCETDINECDPNPCMHYGECIESTQPGSYQCRCRQEYIGVNCEKRKLASCSDNPCENGKCIASSSRLPDGTYFTCNCQPGYTGATCSKMIDFCENINCSNGGTCRNRRPNVGAECVCVPGWDGPTCEKDINECQPGPCKNNGSCEEDKINSYMCKCDGTGFRGETCSEDINECIENLGRCPSNSKCVNIPGFYQCNCNHGLCGQSCTIPDPCEFIHCQNGGTCEPKCDVDEPYPLCICTEGWGGANCTERELGAPSSSNSLNIAFIIIPVLTIILLAAVIASVILVRMARQKRATRGVYSPSQQEYCNPRVELDNVMKPPPEERLI